MLERYKKQRDGLLSLTLLIETSPTTKAKKILEVGFQEDATYMNQVLTNIVEWEDVLALDAMQLGELLHLVGKPPIIALALKDMDKAVVDKFLVSCKEFMGKVKEAIEFPKLSTEPSMVNTARKEHVKAYRNLIASKKVPQPIKNPEVMKKKFGF